MNFQDLVIVERSQVYLDLAFKKAREKSSSKDLKGDWRDKVKTKEMIKLDVVKDQLVGKLDFILKSYPDLRHLPKFYHELFKLTLDYEMLKKSLASLDWAIDKIRYFQKEYAHKIGKCPDRVKIKGYVNEFYGRVSSVLNQIDKQLFFLGQCRKIMKTYPDIKEIYTVCIFGFPNVGKTTLLNELTGSKGKVAAYSFTTQGVNSGFFELEGQKIQMLDVPGTLSRMDKMNNIEKIAYLTMKELANVIIYVFDLTEQCGYSVKIQEQLFHSLGKDKPVLVYLSKRDLLSSLQISNFKLKNYSSVELKEKIIQLKAEIS